jgi:hypothetical protein
MIETYFLLAEEITVNGEPGFRSLESSEGPFFLSVDGLIQETAKRNFGSCLRRDEVIAAAKRLNNEVVVLLLKYPNKKFYDCYLTETTGWVPTTTAKSGPSLGFYEDPFGKLAN